MNKKQLSHLEKRLLEERARVMKELGYYDESFNATLQSSDGDLSSYSFHMADQGTDAMEREKQFLFASQEGRYLWHVNEALRRLYGTPRRAPARAAVHHLQGERGRWKAPLSPPRARSAGSSGLLREWW
jgi:RNA polymerase-binding transcription factor DksA